MMYNNVSIYILQCSQFSTYILFEIELVTESAF